MTTAEQFAAEYALVDRDNDEALTDLIGRVNAATTTAVEVPGRSADDGAVHVFADGSWLDTHTLKVGSDTTTFIKRGDGSLAKEDKD